MSLSFSNEHHCFRNQYFMSLKRMFGDRNVHKTFSALNLTIICIKPFTSNNTTFSSILLKCWMKHYFSIKHCLLNTSSLFWTAFKTWLNTDWLTQQAFISDIPSSQMHSSPTTDNSVSSFNFYVICTFNNIHLCIKDVWFTYIYKMFPILIL